MRSVGITGGIGSGKSVVCSVFRELGAAVYDSDLRARVLMEGSAPLVESIKSLLGGRSYNGGTLDRQYVASRVFDDVELLRQLNSIVHPAVADDFRHWVEFLRSQGVRYAILESAILFESGFVQMVDCSVTVSAAEELRVARVVSRDGAAAEDIRARIKNQMDDSRREMLADYIVVNDDNALVVPQVVALHNRFWNENR